MTDGITVNYMDRYRTLTGLTLTEAVERLAAVLPPRAYKEITGSSVGLTDINSAYLTDVATKVFGLVGIGWVYDYDPNKTTVHAEPRKSRSGREYTSYVASIPFLTLRYAYIDEEGNQKLSMAVSANGGSDNEEPDYALRGALTNAISAAFAKLCWQIQVYKGIVDHNNAAEKYEKQKAKSKAPETVAEEELVREEKKEPASKSDSAVVPQKEEPQAPVSKKDAPAVPIHTPEAVAVPTDVQGALTLVVPTDLVELPATLLGKTLKEVSEDALWGERGENKIIGYLSGAHPRKSGDNFDASTPERVALQTGAKILYDDYLKRVSASKKSKKQ